MKSEYKTYKVHLRVNSEILCGHTTDESIATSLIEKVNCKLCLGRYEKGEEYYEKKAKLKLSARADKIKEKE